MKIFYSLVIGATLLLSGCSEKEEKINFIETNVGILEASNEVDVVLKEQLKSAQANNTDFSQLINDIKSARDFQKNLYGQIMSDANIAKEIKNPYLEMINARIKTYDSLVEISSKENYDSFNESVKKYEITSVAIEKKALKKINKQRESLKMEPLDELKEKK